MKKIVVTGATSFIGAPLVEILSKKYFVYAVIRPASKNIVNIIQNSNIKIIECDISNLSFLDKLILEKCDCFYHIAWNGTRVPERNDYLIQNQNYIDCIKAYETAKKLGCECFISTGSQAEYGNCVGIINDDYPTNPISEYGIAKLKSFKEIKNRAKDDNIKFGWIRIFSAYGPGDYNGSLISYCIDKMKKNEDVVLTSCKQNWNYIFVEDVINILVLLFEIDSYSIESFNVCSDDSRILRDYVIEIKKIINSSSQLLFGNKEYDVKEGVVSFSPQNGKIKKILNYNKFISFKEGIEKILATR